MVIEVLLYRGSSKEADACAPRLKMVHVNSQNGQDLRTGSGLHASQTSIGHLQWGISCKKPVQLLQPCYTYSLFAKTCNRQNARRIITSRVHGAVRTFRR